MIEFLALYVNIGNSIDSLWNIFMGLHLVLFASILKYGRTISIFEKFGFVFSYLMFFIMNCRAIMSNYNMLEEFRKSFVSTIPKDNPQNLVGLASFMNSHDLTYRNETTIFIHLFGFFVVVYLFYKKSKSSNQIKGGEK